MYIYSTQQVHNRLKNNIIHSLKFAIQKYVTKQSVQNVNWAKS